MLLGAGGEILSCGFFFPPGLFLYVLIAPFTSCMSGFEHVCPRACVVGGGWEGCREVLLATPVTHNRSAVLLFNSKNTVTSTWRHKQLIIAKKGHDYQQQRWHHKHKQRYLLCVIYKSHNKMDHSKMNQQAFSLSVLWRIASRDSVKHDQLFVSVWDAIIIGSLWGQNRIINIYLYIITFAC